MTAAVASLLVVNLVVLLIIGGCDGRLVFSGPTPIREQVPRLLDQQEQEQQLLKDPDIMVIESSADNVKRPVDVFRYSQILDTLLDRLQNIRAARLRVKNEQAAREDSRTDVNRLWEKALNYY